MSLLKTLGLQPLSKAGAAAKVGAAPPGATGTKTGPAADAANAVHAAAKAEAVRNKRLADASDGWRETHREADARIGKLKDAVKAHHADAPKALLDEIETGLARLDAVLDTVDHRLADSMARASQAGNDAARQKELDTAKEIFREYIAYVRSEPLVAHMDDNPFGVKTDLKTLLIAGLTQAGKAIG